MIYSVHNSYTGQFQYFEAAPDVAINDDLPTPRWGSDIKTPIGVPASLAARPLPPGARPVGSGALPVGLISNGEVGMWQGTQKGLLPSGLGSFDNASTFFPLVLAAGAGASAMYGLGRRDRSWPYLALSAVCLLAATWVSTRT